MKSFYLAILSCLFSITATAQIIVTGTTKSTNQEPIIGASITCKSKNTVLAYTFSNQFGQFNLAIPNDKSDIKIIASAIGYAKDSTNLTQAQLDKNFNYNFVLKAQAISLKEVNISLKNLPIIVKKDTTIFNVEAFTNGTESVVEDILKKLPGMEVADNGDLKFKGKKIDEVQFEGDNLLGNNYKLATKNLTANAINKVQAIENYSNTTLLKGIKKGSKTILNLELKDNFKKPIAANIDASAGIKNSYNAGLNLISVAKKFKGFFIGSANNIGEDSAPYYAFIDFNEEENTNLIFQPLNNIISNQISYPNLPEKRYNFNNKVLFSPTGMYKFSNRLSLKLSTSYAFDKNYRAVLSNTNYLLQNANFSLLENQEQQSKPLIFDLNTELFYNINKNSEVRYTLKTTNFNNNVNDAIFANGGYMNGKLLDKNKLTTNNITYLKRLNNARALSVEFLQNYNNLPQNYTLNNNQLSNASNLEQQNFLQTIDNHINSYQARAKIIGKSKRFNYEHFVGSAYNQQKFASFVNVIDSNSNKFKNQLSQNQFGLYLGSQATKQMGNFTLSGTLKLHYLANHLFNEIESSKSIFKKTYLEPIINFSYLTSKHSTLNLSYNRSVSSFTIDKLFGGYVLTDYRSFTNNSSNFGLQATNNLGINYSYADFFNNYFQFFALLNYSWNNKNIGQNLYLQPNYTLNTGTLLAGSNTFFMVLNISKYVDAISSTIKLNSSFNSLSNANILNNTTRKTTMYSAFNEINVRTIINNHISTSLGFTGIFSYSKSGQEQRPTVGNLSSNYSVVLKPASRWLISLSAQTVFGDVYSSSQNPINFMDTSVKYSVEKNKLSIKLLANNIFNERYFRNSSISEYSSYLVDYNILPRTILANIEYRF